MSNADPTRVNRVSSSRNDYRDVFVCEMAIMCSVWRK